MSLYRKHRPQKFIDLIGQEHIKTTLANALENGRFSHAYLFYGPRGSGKTTTARLLAKALNCTGRALGKDNFEPCDQCLSCQEITGGHSLDVIEIDAASNRGIDEIRELRDKIRFAPSTSKFKVYVVDECHMLTKEAFNALLKTLEEPPAHAVFILATTELHKVPTTILSRVQTFDFKKAKSEEIIQLLEQTAKKEKIDIDQSGLKLICKLSFGAFRDALTMLDQVAAVGSGGHIGLEKVQSILGQSTEDEVWQFMDLLAQRDRSKLIELINQIYFEGKDLENFLGEVVAVLRQLILVKSCLKNETMADNTLVLEKLAESFSLEELVQMIERFIEVLPQTKTAVLGQLPIEMAIFELIKPVDVSDLPEVKMKEEPEPQKTKEKPKPENSSNLKSEPVIQNKATKTEVVQVAVVQSNDLGKVWPEIVKYAKSHNNSLAALLKDAAITKIDHEKVVLGVKFKFHADQICSTKNRKLIEEALNKLTQKNYHLECVVDPDLKIKKPIDAEEELLSSAKEIFESA